MRILCQSTTKIDLVKGCKTAHFSEGNFRKGLVGKFFIWHREPMINFVKHLETVCRTNLFQFLFSAVEKTVIFGALTNSIFDAILGDILFMT